MNSSVNGSIPLAVEIREYTSFDNLMSSSNSSRAFSNRVRNSSGSSGSGDKNGIVEL